MALSRTGNGFASTDANYADDDTFLYLQLPSRGEAARAAFSQDVSAGGLLDADNTMHVKMSTWLNTTGAPIHMEMTFTVVFQYIDPPSSPARASAIAASRGDSAPAS